MFIFLKYSIKTSILIVLFIIPGCLSYAVNPITKPIEWSKNLLAGIEYTAIPSYSLTADTLDIKMGQNDTNTVLNTANDLVIPSELINTLISFRVNSYINYTHFKHFVQAESKKSFIQGWLKEKEFQKLSSQTDSLRKAYASASAEEREKISALILQSEEKLMALNAEIPAHYEKAREEENLYWQSASMDEISNFQQKINSLQDSIAKSRNIQPEVPDTITMYAISSYKKVVEVKEEAPESIIYKIQIGAYKGKIPDTANKLIKKLSMIRKVENHVDNNGVKVYTTGNLRSYAEAETMLSQVKQEGVKNAAIIAYQNGKKISITEAKNLNK